MPVFPAWTWFSPDWETPFLILSATAALVCGLTLWRLNRSRPSNDYDPRRAWLRAALYFIGCFVVSWAMGVLPVLVSQPIALPDQLRDLVWIAATAILFTAIKDTP